jgi:hypothetical protein
MAIVLSVMIVYYMRLDSESRLEFIEGIESKISSDFLEGVGIENVLKNAVDAIIKDTEVPAGIALTEGLKENIFMTLVCSLSRTPLMIVGPPGSSKVSTTCMYLIFNRLFSAKQASYLVFRHCQ